MNVLTYKQIIDAITIVQLRAEVENFHPLHGNRWIGLYDKPENTIEKYIQDSFDFHLQDKSGLWRMINPWNPQASPVGFEWWIENTENHNTITFHSNHDDNYRRANHGIIKYPLLSVTTYLTNDETPTMILDTQHGSYWEEHTNFPPTQVTFSVPEEGKLEISDPRYFRGVFNSNPNRIALCYDVWHYRPENLNRVGIPTKIWDCRFYKENPEHPVDWLGKLRYGRMNLFDKTFNLKFPRTHTTGDTWTVNQ